MKLGKILEALEGQFWPEYAMSWDNSGLIVGDREQEIHKVCLALDATAAVIRWAKEAGADLIVTHHPMIFSPVKKINSDDFIGRKVLELAGSHMACYAMHTNFDVLGMADYLAGLLGLEDTRVLEPVEPAGDRRTGRPEGIGRYGTFAQTMTAEQLGHRVKDRLRLPYVLVSGDARRAVRMAAVSSGSGKSMVPAALAAGADVLITGDMDHHTVLDAEDQGLTVIDAGHYGTEYIFVGYMQQWFGKNLPELEVVPAPSRPPLSVI